MNSPIINLSNLLSILRVPLAFAFLYASPLLRCIAIVCAALTDCLDGYFARRNGRTSQFGAVLDPVMDKFFVVFALSVFISEGRLSFAEMSALLCRDFAIVLFGIYLCLTGSWSKYQFRAIWCGKITTAFQFVVLLMLSLNYVIPSAVSLCFVVLGFFALIELYLMSYPKTVKT